MGKRGAPWVACTYGGNLPGTDTVDDRFHVTNRDGNGGCCYGTDTHNGVSGWISVDFLTLG
ncbi:MAG TPA: hypothetical protein VGH57_24020 [Amycolatopsis sp.]